MHIYNEIEPYAARWLRNLCDRNLIAPGKVDERSIRDLTPDDVAGHGQRHFFAGIGGWSLALRMAGWPDELNVWTGSCPCQPFSVAGKRAGTADDRHLWPAWFELIRVCRPPVILGEQVSSPAARAWIDAVRADLEDCGYSFAVADLCAAGVGAPQIRSRLWWVANANDSRWQRPVWQGQPDTQGQGWTAPCCEPLRSTGRHWPPGPGEVDRIPLLANGLPGVVGACKAYGNAIVPAVAAEFIGAVMNVMKLRHNHPGCPLHGKVGTQVEPDPALEPPSQGTTGKSIKVLFDGQPVAMWVALEQVEVVRS